MLAAQSKLTYANAAMYKSEWSVNFLSRSNSHKLSQVRVLCGPVGLWRVTTGNACFYNHNYFSWLLSTADASFYRQLTVKMKAEIANGFYWWITVVLSRVESANRQIKSHWMILIYKVKVNV